MIGAATLEKRAGALEIRAQGRKLEGYAALFGTEARIGSFTESIRAGAFTKTLSSDADVLALVDHDAGRVLARTRSGTLRLTQDTRGLGFALDLPDTQAGRDVLALAERGDLGGMSFGFRVPAGGDQWAGEKRELVDVELLEISVVQAFPAYDGTVVNARARLSAGSMPLAVARFRLASLGGRT